MLLVGVGTVDGLRWLLGVCGSLQLFFFLLDEGALTRPMTFVSAVNAKLRNFLLSARVLPPATIGVVGFVTGDRVHGLRGLHLFSLVWLQSNAIA